MLLEKVDDDGQAYGCPPEDKREKYSVKLLRMNCAVSRIVLFLAIRKGLRDCKDLMTLLSWRRSYKKCQDLLFI